MSEDQRESQELHEYRLKARAWLAENVPSAGVRTNPEEEFESDAQRLTLFRLLQQKLHQAGYAGFTFSKEYGGQGLTLEHERVFLEEATGYDIPGRNFGVSINILGATLARFGSPEQKLEHIPKILSGEELWIQLLSEPSGGSDLAGLLTGATRDGDSFLVNGQKTWSSGAALSDFALCPVRTRWDVPKHKGISMLIVDLRSPGIEVRRIKQIDGRADFCEEFLADVVVPATNLVGEENEGWRVTRGLLEIEHSWAGRSRRPRGRRWPIRGSARVPGGDEGTRRPRRSAKGSGGPPRGIGDPEASLRADFSICGQRETSDWIRQPREIG